MVGRTLLLRVPTQTFQSLDYLRLIVLAQSKAIIVFLPVADQ
jgi:hypothetical protein